MGIICPLGNTVPDFWSAICAGTDGLGEIGASDLADFAFRQGGEVKEIPLSSEALSSIPGKDRATQLAVAATAQAWQQTGLVSGEDVGIVLATNFGSVAAVEQELGVDTDRITGELGFQSTVDICAGLWSCNGPTACLSLSCSSGTAAIGYAVELIRRGRARAVIAGGYDSISRFAWAGLNLLRTTTQDKVRPFSLDRSGTLFAEGAGIMVVEDYESAANRGADILAEIAGFGFNNNAYHMTAPAEQGRGLAEAMTMALQDAGIDPGQVDHINTHGTGTKYNDSTETQAIKTVLENHAGEVPITSIKSMTGHLMGAAGSVEAITAILSLREGLIPPTINFSEPDPECDLPLPVDGPLKHDIKTVISNSSGIGGNNASLVITAVGEDA